MHTLSVRSLFQTCWNEHEMEHKKWRKPKQHTFNMKRRQFQLNRTTVNSNARTWAIVVYFIRRSITASGCVCVTFSRVNSVALDFCARVQALGVRALKNSLIYDTFTHANDRFSGRNKVVHSTFVYSLAMVSIGLFHSLFPSIDCLKMQIDTQIHFVSRLNQMDSFWFTRTHQYEHERVHGLASMQALMWSMVIALSCYCSIFNEPTDKMTHIVINIDIYPLRYVYGNMYLRSFSHAMLF